MAVTAADRARLEPSARAGRPTNRVRAAQLRHQVMNLVVAGATERQIAEALGISERRVASIISKTLDRWLERDHRVVEKVREIQLARIDALVSKLWPAATGAPEYENGPPRQPNLKAIDRITRLEALRARIAGTEAARKIDVSGELGIHITSEQADALDRTWVGTGGDVIDGTLAELDP